jgi:V-type H+-transporting ATPase proteolipid subunit
VIGAAYGTAKSSVGISNMGVLKPDYVMRAIIPVIFAGALGVYGLIIAVILSGNRMIHPSHSMHSAFIYTINYNS